MTAQRLSGFVSGGLALIVCSTALHAAPSGGFIALLDENSSNGSTDLNSLSSVNYYAVNDLSKPLFTVFLGFETTFNFEDPSAMAVDPVTGDTFVLAFDSGTAGTSVAEMDNGYSDTEGGLDLYRINFQAAYDHWATNFQGQGPGGTDLFATYGRGPSFDGRAVSPQTSGPFTFVEKVGEIARSPGDGSFQDPRLEFVNQDTLVFLDASTANDGSAGSNIRVKAINRVSTSPGAATWGGGEEGGFNNTGTTESWESKLLGYLELDATSRSDITDTAMVVNQGGVTGLWVTESDNDATGAFGDDVAFFKITNFFGTAGNGLVEQNVGPGPTYSTDFQLDNNPSVDPSDNTGTADRIFVDPNTGKLIFVESGFLDANDPLDTDADTDLNENGHASFGAHEPTVFTREVLSLNNVDGRINFGAWGSNVVLDTTGLTDDDTAEVVTDGRMSVYDYVNNKVYFYDGDSIAEGGGFFQDWYVLDLNTGVTSFIAQDVDNIISFSFGDDTAEFFCIGCAVALDGDLDGDGFVGITDLNIVLGNWNQNVTPGDPLVGDPSGDGFVGIEDLNEVLGNWNAGTPPAGNAVPEPASLALFTIAGLSGLVRRRAKA